MLILIPYELAILTYLKTSIISLNICQLAENKNIARNYRYAAYRVSCWFIWGKLGARNRVPLPACLGKRICQKITL